MNKVIPSVLLLCIMVSCSTSVMAADACEVVLCMYGKATGNGGGNECHSAERAFFNIVKKNKHGFLPDHTADARKSFLLECDLSTPLSLT
ncbi:TrbM/KikA/MpfK family conjugal transfer protein, partial [Dickeya dianthicola]|uniref:TrbM/KikA/MpfK family conjugal transfer protein n=1 Tax=Dickeya dianthicola TaxID=204039 RepID=UPI001F60918D